MLLLKIVYFLFLSYLRVIKLLISKIIKNNIFEGMKNWFYILLLLDFVFDFQKKNCKYLNDV